MVNNARTIEDLERKYDFNSLLGLKKNIKVTENSLIKVQNELANMLNTLIINLKDVLDNQSEISLWFYSGTPTTSNEPYTNFITPSEHYGDIYYDQATGYVYQLSASGWNKNEDTNLVQAMALTNVELDTTTDHERKVYFTQPTPPYSSGDWWILEDGSLKICQLGKASGDYSTDDFIVSSKYVATIATKTDNTITVLKGTVTTISDNYVSFTDLATGGNTTINGANIKSGTINLSDSLSIANDNIVMNKDGITLKNGADLITDKGMMTNLQFKTADMQKFGISNPYYDQYMRDRLYIYANIPSAFTIVKAYITIVHQAVKWGSSNYVYGYAHDIGIFKSNFNSISSWDWNSDAGLTIPDTGTQLTNIFSNANTWTPTIPSATVYPMETVTTSNIKDYLSNGMNKFMIHTTETLPNPEGQQLSSGQTDTSFCELHSGFAMAILDVYGYLKV